MLTVENLCEALDGVIDRYVDTRRSSNDLYHAEGLVGQQVIGVVNFPPKQIGPIRSQCLITGFPQADGAVVLIQPERPVENGLKLA